MRYPDFEDRTISKTTSGTSHVMTIPAGTGSGDLLLLFWGVATTIITHTLPAEFTQLDSQVAAGQTHKFAYRTADGTEATTVTGTSNSATDSVAIIVRLEGWDSSTLPAWTVSNSWASSIDPASLNPGGWDVEKTLWLAAVSWNPGGSDDYITGWPANCPDNRVTDRVTGEIGVAIATARGSVASFDPDAFTMSGTVYHTFYTVAIRPGDSGREIEEPSLSQLPEDDQPLTMSPDIVVDPWGIPRFHEDDDPEQEESSGPAASIGPALASILTAGAVNADFLQAPPTADYLDDGNRLPGWTFKRVQGSIDAEAIEDVDAPSGRAVRWTARDVVSGDESWLEQIIPIGASTGAFKPRMTVGAASAVAANLANTLYLQGLRADGTLTGSEVSDASATFATSETTVSLSLTLTDEMRFVRVRVGVKATGSVSGSTTRPLWEFVASRDADAHAQSHTHAAAGDGTALSPATLTLPSTITPAQTAEGSVVWDSDDDVLTVGDGVSRKTFGKLGSTVGTTLGTAAAGASVEGSRVDHVHDHGTSGVTADQHHAQSHDHSAAGDGTALVPLTVRTGAVQTDVTDGPLISARATNPAMRLYRASADAVGTALWMLKARGTFGARAAVQNSDTIGSLNAFGWDGAMLGEHAAINMTVGAVAPGASDYPGRLQLATTGDGATSATIRHGVDHTGALFGGADSTYDLGSTTRYYRALYADMPHWGGAISPAQITADTNDYNPSGGNVAYAWRLSTDASRNLTGIAGPVEGATHLLVNVGSFDLVLVHDATSTAANRFLCPGSANVTINPNDSMTIWYDSTSSRWRVIGL